MNFILIDAQAVLYSSILKSGADSVNTLNEKDAAIRFFAKLADILTQYPSHLPVVLWDAPVRWRCSIYPAYKEDRGLDPLLIDARLLVDKVTSELQTIASSIGLFQIIPDYYEADDLAKIFKDLLVTQCQSLVLATTDTDWLQLVDHPSVIWQQIVRDRKIISFSNFSTELPLFKDSRHFIESKILYGDKSDSISGLSHIGEKTAAYLVAQYGGLAGLVQAISSRKIEKSPLVKKPVIESLYSDSCLSLIEINSKLMDLSLIDNHKTIGFITYKNNLNLDRLNEYVPSWVSGSFKGFEIQAGSIELLLSFLKS